ncbi:MAG TPA: Gfo/Idh/MocA family oxidoreductase [Planctomycetota bacterium]|nr:Gfo/Idh/MocA family oxidoreductase [Planctomycetota bacterium]
MQKQDSNRRDFLKTSGAAATAAAVAVSIASKAHAAGNDLIRVALIGAGGRGRGAAVDCVKAGGNVKIVAVADAFEANAKGTAAAITKECKDKADIPPERIFVGLDAYKKAIDCGVDMVILATPPGFRPQHYEAAIEAGKHVFMEKPVCVCPGGFRKVMAANKKAQEKNLKVGVGLQRHHQSGYLGTMQAIQDGKFGEIHCLRAYWNGQDIWYRGKKDDMTELQFQVHNWYHFMWLSGDNICEQHIHNIDIGNWVMSTVLNVEGENYAHPIEANGMGCNLTRGYNGKDKRGQLFDAHFVEFTYDTGTKMISQCRHQPGTWTSVSEHIHSSKFPKGAGASGQGPKLQFDNPYVQEHYDLQQAIAGDKKFHEGWLGAISSMTAILGRTATYTGQVVKWNDLVNNGADSFPTDISSWGSPAPVQPDANGMYPIPLPGQYKYPKKA